jgi:hypothetical protein
MCKLKISNVQINVSSVQSVPPVNHGRYGRIVGIAGIAGMAMGEGQPNGVRESVILQPQ